MKMHHEHGCGHPPMPHPHHFPKGLLIFPLSMVIGTYLSLCLMQRLTKALETMAMAKALRDMEGRLSEGERADLEARIRGNLFT